MRNLAASGALVAALALIATPLAAETAPPMSAKDLVTLPRLGAPAVNAAGTMAVYGVTTTDPESLARSTAYYLHDLAKPGAAPVALALAIKVSSPSFGPDGQLYFLSSGHTDAGTDARGRVWRVALGKDGTAGAPQLVAGYPDASIAGFKLAPNGKAIALWAEVTRDCPKLGCGDAKPGHLPGPGTGRLYDGAGGFVRHWDRWATPGTPNRIFVFPLEGGHAQGDGVPVDGTDAATGITADTPTMPFGGGEEIAFSPDGKALYFTARLADGAEPGSTNLDIYASDLGGGAPKLLTGNNAATDTAPTPSPDGRYFATAVVKRFDFTGVEIIEQVGGSWAKGVQVSDAPAPCDLRWLTGDSLSVRVWNTGARRDAVVQPSNQTWTTTIR